ncbi:MAG: ATP-binding protein [Scytonema sp. PMC 1069.18]|nr:ATP-binding protein [Scytonema sp. PMC 1069.18]MEC4886294.1 ATP-binding protein [Scytonema sp. PMC 1070.18]
MPTFAPEAAIIKSCLSLVTPETPLVDIIPLFSQMGCTSILPVFNQALLETPDAISLKGQVVANCVLVMEKGQLVGLLTERELVRFVALGQTFENVKVVDVMAQHPIILNYADFRDIQTVVKLFREDGIYYLPIVSDDGQLLGIVTPDSLCQSLQATGVLRTLCVTEVMETKVIHAQPTVSILKLAQVMVEHQVASVAIAEKITENTFLPIGIVTERDILRLQAQTPDLSALLVQTAINSPLLCLKKEDSLWTAHQQMLFWQVQELVVSGDRGEMLGLVTQTNLLQTFDPAQLSNIIQVLQEKVCQLESERVELLQGDNLKIQEQGKLYKPTTDEIEKPQFTEAVLQKQLKMRLQECNISNFKQINEQLKLEILERLRAEAELQKAKDQLQAVLDAVPAFVSWISSDLKYLGVNQHLAKAFKQPPEAFVGQPFGFLQNSLEFREFASQVFDGSSDTVTHEVSVDIDGLQKNYFIVAQKYAQQTSAVLIGIDITNSKQTEKQLQRQLAAVEAATDGIAILDSESKYIYVNQAYVQLFGYTHTESLLGKTWSDIYYAEENSPFEVDVLPILKQKGYWQGEVNVRKRDGNTFVGEVSLTMISDGNFICVSRDITERKHIEAERDRLLTESRYNQALLSGQNHFLEMVATGTPLVEALAFLALLIEEQSDEGICCILQTDPKSKQLCSPVAPNLPPTYLSELIKGIPIDPMGASSGTAAYFQKTVIVSDIAKDPLWENYQDLRNLALSYKLQACWSIPIFTGNGDVVGTISMYYRTPRLPKEQDKKLLLAFSRLAGIAIERQMSEIALREQQNFLQKALEKEKELNQLKSRFVSMTSHEFRTPLTTIMGATELLKHYSHQWNEDKKVVYFNRIHTAVNRMTQMLDDMLLLGKVEAGKWDFNPVWLNLVNFCNSIVEELQFGATREHKVIFTVEGEATDVYIDEKLLRHILTNLLSNAIKYSPLGGDVYLLLKFLNKNVIFQVQDRGIGIPKEDQKHLFEGFYRANNVGKISGTGLGLAIVKKAVELHKGKITVNSEVGVGTTFTVNIPIDTEMTPLSV